MCILNERINSGVYAHECANCLSIHVSWVCDFFFFHFISYSRSYFFFFFFIINITVVCSQSGRGLLASAQATNLFFVFLFHSYVCVCVCLTCAINFRHGNRMSPVLNWRMKMARRMRQREREHTFSVVMIYVEIRHPKFACPNNADEKRCCECTRAYSTNSTGKKKETQPTIK